MIGPFLAKPVGWRTSSSLSSKSINYRCELRHVISKCVELQIIEPVMIY